jgi:hypothetical protein
MKTRRFVDVYWGLCDGVTQDHSADRMAEEPVTSELLSGREHGKLQGKLRAWRRPDNKNGRIPLRRLKL